MSLKKHKRKRKHSTDKSRERTLSDNSDKYRAYVKKVKKDKKKDKQAYAVVKPDEIGDVNKKSKKKKNVKEITSTNENIVVTATPNVSIFAKPKLNKNAILLNKEIKGKSKIVSTKKKKEKSNLKASKKKPETIVIVREGMELIMPKTPLMPNIDNNEPSTSFSEIQSLCIKAPIPGLTIKELKKAMCSPVVIETNLKDKKIKTPEFLRKKKKKNLKQYDVVVSESEDEDDQEDSEEDDQEGNEKNDQEIMKEKQNVKKSLQKKNKKKIDQIDKSNLNSNDSIIDREDSTSNTDVNKSCETSNKKIVEENDNAAKYSVEVDKNKTNDSIDKSVQNSSNSNIVLEDSNSDIPKALQEFYEEVTRGFESLTQKPSKNKDKKTKSALTMDKSVTDSNSLADIVNKNTTLIDNLSLLEKNVVQFFSLESKVILVLSPGTQFSFLGKLRLKVAYGSVEIYGSTFSSQSKPVEVYSPRGYSSVSISTSDLENTYDKETLWDILTSEGVDRSLKTKLHDAIQECKIGWSVLVLENFENTLTNFLNNHCSFKLFPKIDNIRYAWCDPRRAECILQTNFQFYSSKEEISLCPQWNATITNQLLNQWNSKKTLCTVITGGKGVGKSTTARYLINNLLKYSKKVVLLDLDPGQAEMTPAACVSLNILDEPLLGPNFTHLKIPFYQLYLEDVNISNCITRYIECIKKLIDCLKSAKNLAQYPIIVNTMGFCKGIGLDICIFLLKLIQPTNVIQIISKRAKNNFDFALLKETINKRNSSISWDKDNTIFEKTCDYELHYVPSMAEGKRLFDTWNMMPRDQRELVLLSYLSEIIKNADDKCFCSITSSSINNVIPYTLPFSSFYISLIKSNVSPTHILAAMNGNIVALCGIDLDTDVSESDKKSLNYPMVVIKPPSCPCYGYGIVRGIDINRKLLYLNTPLTKSVLRHVNLLVGCSAVPFTLLKQNENDICQPYAGDRGELPTAREARRGNFRVDQTKNA